MYLKYLIIAIFFCVAWSAPQKFEKKVFKVGIEYDHSLPMTGGSDRYRHRNNYDPFFVTVSAKAKNGYVISYIEVTATVDEGGDVDFRLFKPVTGSKNLIFQLVSNHSDFLKYSYLTYGIREEEYNKISNVIHIPIPGNSATEKKLNLLVFVVFMLFHVIHML